MPGEPMHVPSGKHHGEKRDGGKESQAQRAEVVGGGWFWIGGGRDLFERFGLLKVESGLGERIVV